MQQLPGLINKSHLKKITAILALCLYSKVLFIPLAMGVIIGLYIYFKIYKPKKPKHTSNHSNSSPKNISQLNDIFKHLNPNGELPFVLGLDENNKPVLADMNRILSSLVAGLSGRGKSNFINQLLQSLIYWNSQKLALILIDFKKVELLHDYSHFQNVFTLEDIDKLIKILRNLIVEMNKRYDCMLKVPIGTKAYKKISQYNEKNKPLPYILVLIDEFADLNDIKDSSKKELIWDMIRELLRKGRAAGIILSLCTQRPTKENIDPRIKGLVVSKLGFGVNNNNESYYCGVEGTSNLPVGEYKISTDGDLHNKKFKSFFMENDKTFDELTWNIKEWFRPWINLKKYTNV